MDKKTLENCVICGKEGSLQTGMVYSRKAGKHIVATFCSEEHVEKADDILKHDRILKKHIPEKPKEHYSLKCFGEVE